MNFVAVNHTEMATMVFKDLHDPNFRGCIIDLSLNLNLAEKMQSSLKFNRLLEIISLNHAVCFERLSFMSPIFRLKIEQLVTGGIWEKMQSYYNHILKLSSKKPQPKPYDTVLTLKHLSIGFYIWLLMILISSLAFIGEILKYWVPKVARMLFFEYILSRFNKMQRSMN